jgi:hypothetical protein
VESEGGAAMTRLRHLPAMILIGAG